MIFSEMDFKSIIVDVVLLLPAPAIATVANVAAFVFVSTMCIKFIVSVEALPAESAFRVSLKSALVDRTRIIVAELLVLPELRKCEELVFVSKDFLVPRTEVTKFRQYELSKGG